MIEEAQGKGEGLKWSGYWIERGFASIEKQLQDSAGQFCVGDDVSIADLYVFPQFFRAYALGADPEKFPTIHRVYKNLMNIEGFKRVLPID
jgi:glutathione S-transferase